MGVAERRENGAWAKKGPSPCSFHPCTEYVTFGALSVIPLYDYAESPYRHYWFSNF